MALQLNAHKRLAIVSSDLNRFAESGETFALRAVILGE